MIIFYIEVPHLFLLVRTLARSQKRLWLYFSKREHKGFLPRVSDYHSIILLFNGENILNCINNGFTFIKKVLE